MDLPEPYTRRAAHRVVFTFWTHAPLVRAVVKGRLFLISFSGAAFVWVGMFGKCDFPSVSANPVIPTVSTSISYKIRYIVLKREIVQKEEA